MRYLAGLWTERLISRCLITVLLLCVEMKAQGVERIYYHINDPSGSPVMVVDAEGAIIARYTYAPFGSQVPAQAMARQRLGFVGGIRETPGLHYLKHRYYNPQLGRFYQPDPVGFLQRGVSQINRYGYGANDPHSYRDISGQAFTQLPDDVLSTLKVSGSDILSFQWLRQAFAGNISQEDNRQLNSKFLESYLEGQKNFIRGGGLVLLVIPGDELFVANGIANPIPYELARVIPGRGSFSALGAPTSLDVFVTAADDIAGMNAGQIAHRLTIDGAGAFTVIRFPTPLSGLASPINRLNPGFVGGGRTAGGAREFVIPNGPIPAGARVEVVGK